MSLKMLNTKYVFDKCVKLVNFGIFSKAAQLILIVYLSFIRQVF